MAKRPPRFESVMLVTEDPLETYHKLRELLSKWSDYLEQVLDYIEEKQDDGRATDSRPHRDTS